LSISPVVSRWAKAKRELLEQIQRNQPAPYGKLTAAIAIRTGLKGATVVRWIDELLQAGLVRLDAQYRLQLEESAEALLGYK